MVFCTGFVLAEFPVDCEITGCVAFLGVEVTGGIIGCDVGLVVLLVWSLGVLWEVVVMVAVVVLAVLVVMVKVRAVLDF